MKVQETPNGLLVRTPNNHYAFHYVRGDTIRGGEKADIEGCVTYVGDSLSKHYVDSKPLSGVPSEVVEAVETAGVTPVEGVEGGWNSWNGRPEFSTTYVDVAEMKAV
jgi:hypothetical protein